MTDIIEGGPAIADLLEVPLLTRPEWSAEAAVGWPVETAPLRALVVHHTATRNDDPDPVAMVRRVQRFHAHERGWGDIGYSFVVLADGRVLEGREGSARSPLPRAVVAGHAYGHNHGTLGIALAGRFHDQRPTAAAWASLVDLVAAVCRTGDLDPRGGPVALANGNVLPAVISGHRHACPTTCPGDTLVAALDDLRVEAGSRLV